LIPSNKILLASESKNKKEILSLLGLKDVESSRHFIDEDTFKFEKPLSRSVIKLAELKAKSVRKTLKEKRVVIAGDTIVFRGGKIFQKVNSLDDVKNYLLLLSGRKHLVYGGLCVISLKGEVFRRFIRTEVVFHKIEEKDITKEILNDGVGKAGGYAIQNLGSRFIKKIRGCYTNVVGISIPELYKILRSLEF
tara:strand:+ start:581 stop:1159 length:579 start_codon:yes stop_codon:yes gene_type:complete